MPKLFFLSEKGQICKGLCLFQKGLSFKIVFAFSTMQSATNPSPENVDGGKTSSFQTEVLLSQSKGHSFEMDTEDSSELGAERSSSSSQCSYAEVSNAMADEKASRTKKIVMSVTTHSSGFDADVGSDCKSTLQQSNLQLQVQRPTSPDHSQASLTLKPCVVKLIRLDDTPVLKMWLQAQQLKDETTNSHCPLQTEGKLVSWAFPPFSRMSNY